jgi:hypothetical protein
VRAPGGPPTYDGGEQCRYPIRAGRNRLYVSDAIDVALYKQGCAVPADWSTQMSSIRKVITLAGALAIFAARTLSQVCEVRYE